MVSLVLALPWSWGWCCVLISVWDWGAVFSMKETHSSGHSFVVERG